MDNKIAMNPNPVIQYLNKPAGQLTKEDLIRFIEDYDIQMINFRYVGWDGRLKTLNFIIGSREHLDNILTAGERVDGSSLFPFVEADSSDLYVIPRYKTAFLDPFSEIPTLNILCAYYDRDGMPVESAPEHILKKEHQAFKDKTGYSFEAMGELEYYIISKDDRLFKAGSGLHIHSRVMKENKNLMIKDGVLSDVARTVIAGYKEIYMQYNVFPKGMLNYLIDYLKAFQNEQLRDEISSDDGKVMELVTQYFHCG